MTTTAAASFTIESQAGDSNDATWTGSGLFTATTTFWVTGGTKTLILSIPSFMADLDYGSEFESLKVTLKSQYTGTSGSYPESAWMTYDGHRDATLFPLGDVTNGSFTTHTLDGDKSYWGLRDTTSQIFRDLKDGNIQFNYVAAGSGAGVDYSVKSIEATLTYKIADQLRASFIVALP